MAIALAIETDCGGGVVAVETAVVAAVGGFLHGQKYWLQDVCPQIQADLPCTTSRHLLTLQLSASPGYTE